MPQQDEPTWKTSLNNAVTNLLKALEDASKLTVETRILKVGAPGSDAEDVKGKLVARTEIRVDGDTFNNLPVIDEEKGEVHEGLLALHNQSIDRALKYRSELIASAQQMVKDLIEMLKST